MSGEDFPSYLTTSGSTYAIANKEDMLEGRLVVTRDDRQDAAAIEQNRTVGRESEVGVWILRAYQLIMIHDIYDYIK